jgi:hypothetical protein
MRANYWLLGLCCFCLGGVGQADSGYPHPKSLFHLARITTCDILAICSICRARNLLIFNTPQAQRETFDSRKETFDSRKETFDSWKGNL